MLSNFFNSKSLNTILTINIIVFILYHLITYIEPDLNLKLLLALNSKIYINLILTHLFLTSGFFHIDITHFFSNMIAIIVFYKIISKNSDNVIIEVYIKSAILGGILWLFYIQTKHDYDTYILLGASSGIMGLITYSCNVLRNEHLFKIFNVRFLYIYILYIFLYLSFVAMINDENFGGEIAHLGGVIMGYIVYFKYNEK